MIQFHNKCNIVVMFKIATEIMIKTDSLNYDKKIPTQW